MLNFLETIKQYNIVVVFSNHDDFLTRFINNGDIKKNIKNAYGIYGIWKSSIDGKAPNGIVPYIINSRFPKIKCLGKNESYKVKGWSVLIHGHLGSGGSRGSVQTI